MDAQARVICVYKTGGDFRPEHVQRLALQVAAHSPVGLTCLTDAPSAFDFGPVWEVMALERGWPGWWSKIEALRVQGPALYLDLDVNVIGSLEPLLAAAADHDFMMLRDFWECQPHKVNSSVMGWRGDVSALYREFATAPVAYMDLYRHRERWGDQAFIRDTYAAEPTLWQDALPGACVSFKRGVLMGENAVAASVIVSHGEPRPWEPGGADAWLSRKRTSTAA